MKIVKIRRCLAMLTVLLAFCALLAGCSGDAPPDPLANLESTYVTWIESACPYLTKLPDGTLVRRYYGRFEEGNRTYPMFEYLVKANRDDAVFILNYVIEINETLQPVKISSSMSSISFLLVSSRTTEKGAFGMENRYLGITLPSSQLTKMIERLLDGDRFDDLVEKTKDHNWILQTSNVDTDDLKDL